MVCESRWRSRAAWHHAFADRYGDPHSPCRFGTTPATRAKGVWHAHMGWLFDRDIVFWAGWSGSPRCITSPGR